MRGVLKGLLYFSSGGFAGHAPERLRPILGALGLLMIAGIAGFCAYNLYSAMAYGEVFESRRSGRGRWIAYGDRPGAFTILTMLYAVVLAAPALGALAILLDRFREEAVRRRALTKALSGESAVRPVVRRIDER